MTTVYVVTGDAGYGDGTWVDAVFSDEARAIAHVASKVGSSYGFEIDEIELDVTE